MKKLIAIKTCHARVRHAQAQRLTWVKDIVASGAADVKFFLGKPEHEAFEGPELDEVWMQKCPDDYTGIPLKVQGICTWAYEHGYEQTMICDDDTYVVPKRFASLPVANYVGRFRGPHGSIYPVGFASGFAYWLSGPACFVVARTEWNHDWMDERFVATALAHSNIFGHHDPINYMVTGPSLDGKTVLDSPAFKNGTAFCEYGPLGMHDMHRAFKDVGLPDAMHPGLQAQPLVMVSDAVLAARPADTVPPHKLQRSYRAG
jgi:hypothetical protein